MSTLTPQQAADIASGVYLLRTQKVSELQRRGEKIGCEGNFLVDDSTRFFGSSGASVVKAETGFGYFARGTGNYSGELLCVTRGTVSGYDWASNLHMGVTPGPSGNLVHTGFNDLWKTLHYANADPIRDYLAKVNPSRVHCVGHSLGGALAMLYADFFSAQKIPVSVYTFGAPRVGSWSFANDLTKRVGAIEVFRMSHVLDPVPMIPVLPFFHAPTQGTSYVIGSRGGSFPVSVSAHFMRSSYIPALAEHGWDAFKDRSGEISAFEVDNWMTASSAGERVVMYSASALRMIGRVLRWLLVKAGEVLINSLGLTATAGITALDTMAWMIQRAAEFAKDLAGYAMAMIKAIFGFLGRVATTGAELTASFLRWVLSLLFDSVSSLAKRATAMV